MIGQTDNEEKHMVMMVTIVRTSAAALLALAALGVAGPADGMAQTNGVCPSPGTAAPAAISEEERISRMNCAQDAAVRAQNSAYDAERRAFEEETAAVEAAKVIADTQRRAYDIEIQAYNRTVQEHQANMRRWEEDVAACQAGNFARCHSTVTTPR